MPKQKGNTLHERRKGTCPSIHHIRIIFVNANAKLNPNLNHDPCPITLTLAVNSSANELTNKNRRGIDEFYITFKLWKEPE